MIGLGTIINVVAIIIGGLLGKVCGGFLSKRYQETLNMACGVSVLFLGIAGALEGMLIVEDTAIVSGQSMLIVLSLVLTVPFNNQGLLGYLPFAVCTIYVLFMDIKDPFKFKVLVTLTFVPWIFYFFIIKS